METGPAHVAWGMEGFGVEPKTVDSTAETVCFVGSEEASRRAGGAAPFLGRVDEYDLVGDAADGKQTLDKSKGLRRCRARDLHRLTGVVCYKADSVVEGA